MSRNSLSDAVVAIQAYLAEVGIDAEVVKPDRATYSALRKEGWQDGVLLQGLTCDNPSYVAALQKDGPSPNKSVSTAVHDDYHALLAEAATVLACLDAEGKVQRVPKFMYPEE